MHAYMLCQAQGEAERPVIQGRLRIGPGRDALPCRSQDHPREKRWGGLVIGPLGMGRPLRHPRECARKRQQPGILQMMRGTSKPGWEPDHPQPALARIGGRRRENRRESLATPPAGGQVFERSWAAALRSACGAPAGGGYRRSGPRGRSVDRAIPREPRWGAAPS